MRFVTLPLRLPKPLGLRALRSLSRKVVPRVKLKATEDAASQTLLQKLRNLGRRHSKAIGIGGYVLLTAQWCMDDVLLLRSFGVACATSMAIFLYSQPVPLMVPVRFNLLFIAINGYHIGKILVHRRDLKLDEVEQMLWDAGFNAFLTKVELRELLAQGERYSAEKDMVIAQSGMPVCQKVIVLAQGGISQTRAGKEVATILPGDFWGEFQLVERARNTGAKHKLTTMFSEDSIAIEWDAVELSDYLKSKPALKHKLQELWAEGLNLKLDRRNADVGERAYVDILRGILCGGDGSIGETEFAFLSHVRQVHNIQHHCHIGALQELGYSEKEFVEMVRRGRRPWFLRWIRFGGNRSFVRSVGFQPDPKLRHLKPALLPEQRKLWHWPNLEDIQTWSPRRRTKEASLKVQTEVNNIPDPAESVSANVVGNANVVSSANAQEAPSPVDNGAYVWAF